MVGVGVTLDGLLHWFGTLVWYTSIVYGCGTLLWYTGVVYLCGTLLGVDETLDGMVHTLSSAIYKSSSCSLVKHLNFQPHY